MLTSGHDCAVARRVVICRQAGPHDILVELETSWVTVNDDALMRGRACQNAPE